MQDFTQVSTLNSLWVGHKDGIGLVQLNRPSKSNAVSMAMVEDLPQAMNTLDAMDQVKVVLLTGAGKNFCAGLDFAAMQSVTQGVFAQGKDCPAQQRRQFLRVVASMQVRFCMLLAMLHACRFRGVSAADAACLWRALAAIWQHGTLVTMTFSV